MKNVYIVLTQSGTIFSRILKSITHEEYNHASICIDEDFSKFYSFGRIYLYHPFVGGFVIENAFTHVLGHFKYVPTLILKKEVSDEQYKTITETINLFVENPKNYNYDFANLFLAKTKYTAKHKNRFFCSEFVAYVLSCAGIKIPNQLEKIRPFQFTNLEDAEIIYKGELKEWCKSKSLEKTHANVN